MRYPSAAAPLRRVANELYAQVMELITRGRVKPEEVREAMEMVKADLEDES